MFPDMEDIFLGMLCLASNCFKSLWLLVDSADATSTMTPALLSLLICLHCFIRFTHPTLSASSCYEVRIIDWEHREHREGDSVRDMARPKEKNKWTKKETWERESKDRCGYGPKRGRRRSEEGRIVNERMC